MAAKVLRRVDRYRFFMWLAYVGIAVAIVIAIRATVRTNHEEARQRLSDAQRVAETRAAATQQVATCFASVKNAPVVAGFIAGQRALIVNGIDGNEAALKLPNQDPKLAAVRRASLRRLLVAKANNDVLAALIASTTPTRKSCVTLAKKTHVQYQQYLPKHQAAADIRPSSKTHPTKGTS